MTYLLYGIVFSGAPQRARGGAPLVLPPGVGGSSVRLIEEGGLGAAISTIDPADLTPNVARVLSFSEVVAALHADRTVLPMRFGCLFGDEWHVVNLLRARGEDYTAILHGLDGCVEMGVRILLPVEPFSPPFRLEREGTSGRAYLAHRAARYAREEVTARALATLTERARRGLAGLAERTETDNNSRADQRFSSLYFLVKRGLVESFRREFRRIERAESARFLLSGPWPPYTFVAPSPNGNGRG